MTEQNTLPQIIVELSHENAELIIHTNAIPNVVQIMDKDDTETLIQDLRDCGASGDCQPAVEYVLSQYDVKWIANGMEGDIGDVKKEICESIYFESESDFSDEDTADLYLMWSASHDFIYNLDEDSAA